MQAMAHMAAGVAAVSIASLVGARSGHRFEAGSLPLYYAIGVAAALLPDIDHLGSKLGRQAKWLMLGVGAALVAALATMDGPVRLERIVILLALLGYYLAAIMGGHRSPWTHSLWPCLGGSLLAMAAASGFSNDPTPLLGAEAVGLTFGFGYGSHLLLDSFTRQGVPLFWPLLRRKVGPRLVTTGGASETVVTVLCLALATLPLLV